MAEKELVQITKDVMKGMLPLVLAIIVTWLIVWGLAILFLEPTQETKQEQCFDKSLRLWLTVNEDYPLSMSSQESYDKNNRQACASMQYIACMNDRVINCASTLAERNTLNSGNTKEIDNG